MKHLAVILLLVLIKTQFIYCSGGPPPPPPVFVNAEISGVVHIGPLFLSDTSKAVIIVGASYAPASSVDFHGNVSGIFDEKSDNPRNMNWKIPSASYTMGINFQIFRDLAVLATINYDSRDGSMKFTGSEFGLGLALLSRKELSARLDFRLFQQRMNYDANFETENNVNYETETQTLNFRNISKSVNPSVSLSLNTAMPDWLVNPFLHLSYNTQTLFKLPDSYSREVFCRISYYNITPGVSYKLSEKFLVLAGSNLILLNNLDESSSDLIASGFAQVNFRIN